MGKASLASCPNYLSGEHENYVEQDLQGRLYSCLPWAQCLVIIYVKIMEV